MIAKTNKTLKLCGSALEYLVNLLNITVLWKERVTVKYLGKVSFSGLFRTWSNI